MEFQRAKRYNRPLSIIIFDIDNFKKVNDELGHLMGDKALISIAQAAKSNIRSSDTVGRWGGEEFLVICPETSAEDAFLAYSIKYENLLNQALLLIMKEYVQSVPVLQCLWRMTLWILFFIEQILFSIKQKTMERIKSSQGDETAKKRS